MSIKNINVVVETWNPMVGSSLNVEQRIPKNSIKEAIITATEKTQEAENGHGTVDHLKVVSIRVEDSSNVNQNGRPRTSIEIYPRKPQG